MNIVSKILFTVTAIAAFSAAYAQTTYLPLGLEDYQTLDRLETRSGKLSQNLYLSVKPVQRKGYVAFLQELISDTSGVSLSGIDRYNVEHAISVSGEWAADENGAIDSKKPVLKHFYKKQPDLVYVNKDNFFLSINPVITATLIYDKNGSQKRLFTSNRGAEIRGHIAKRIGFYTFFTDNQEAPPEFAKQWIDAHHAVPGADFYTIRSAKYDYLLARGYLDFAVIKDHINVTFGYDKHFIGDGQRSLFLSDFSAAGTFLRINTRIWKFNYQNLFMELVPQYTDYAQINHKYATMHHLSINATKWLNVGIFESVMFGRKDRYEFSYMVPIILYRQIERALGSPDNVLLGLNFKAIALKHLQFYGQIVLDELKTKELLGGKGWWANKFGVQLGAKYFDAFTVRNLDLQGELNIVRPFTYSHYDSVANYTHYNQPLAHPLGASFAELRGTAMYQPVKKLYLTAEAMYYLKGADTGKSNYGGNIFQGNETRKSLSGNRNFDYPLISGIKTNCMLLSFNASYELRENLFIDLGATHRRFYFDNIIDQTDTYIQGGIRLNFARRNYNFF